MLLFLLMIEYELKRVASLTRRNGHVPSDRRAGSSEPKAVMCASPQTEASGLGTHCCARCTAAVSF